ncbi:unannotated protein [freshwater metagenome]|uniref:Unannotated protein n=1 Tax=freshwater metagenome TaxID=449393 RepID=A0A6J6XPC0_9ZZZZ
MRPSIAAAEDDVGVIPQFASHVPMSIVIVGSAWPQDRAEIVGDDNVDERVEWFGVAAFGSDIAYFASGESLIRSAERVANDVVSESGKAAEHARLFAVGTGDHHSARCLVAQHLDAFRNRCVEDRSPSGHQIECAVISKTHVHRNDHWHSECHDPTADFACVLRDRKMAVDATGVARVNNKQVPVERSVGPHRHCWQEFEF